MTGRSAAGKHYFLHSFSILSRAYFICNDAGRAYHTLFCPFDLRLLFQFSLLREKRGILFISLS
jgi:hypothetical protein